MKCYRVFYANEIQATFVSPRDAALFISSMIGNGAEADLFHLTSDTYYTPDTQEGIF
jgi:hypothetical protein